MTNIIDRLFAENDALESRVATSHVREMKRILKIDTFQAFIRECGVDVPPRSWFCEFLRSTVPTKEGSGAA